MLRWGRAARHRSPPRPWRGRPQPVAPSAWVVVTIGPDRRPCLQAEPGSRGGYYVVAHGQLAQPADPEAADAR